MSRRTNDWKKASRKIQRHHEHVKEPHPKPDAKRLVFTRSKSGTIKTLPESEMPPMTYALRMARGGPSKRKPSLPKFSWDKEDGE